MVFFDRGQRAISFGGPPIEKQNWTPPGKCLGSDPLETPLMLERGKATTLDLSGSRVMAKRIEPVDALVGRRVRAYRLSLGMSQTTLGEKVGVTFQQI